ncbi:MAG TPA: TorF family putative porin [Sphingomicrobium sp.]|nr:TorF family putative porin [Sphingomicrobium sp.]
MAPVDLLKWLGAARRSKLPTRAGCAFIFSLLFADPAAAQIAGSLGLDSDYRLRGYSLTNDHPAATAQITLDHSSGLYVSMSALAEIGDDSRVLGAIGNAGYAKRLSNSLTIDAGVLRSQIRSEDRGGPGFKYTEIYAGAYIGPVVGRVYYSPDYRTSGQSTIYGELETGFEPWTDWRLSGHVGLLTYLNSTRYWSAGQTHHDWRVALARRLGRFEMHAAVSGGGPETYYGNRAHDKAKVSVGGSVSL